MHPIGAGWGSLSRYLLRNRMACTRTSGAKILVDDRNSSFTKNCALVNSAKIVQDRVDDPHLDRSGRLYACQRYKDSRN